MTLDIISPEHTTTHSIAWIELNTISGNLIISRGHAPTVLLLAENQQATFKLKTGKQQTIAIASGIAEITRDGVQLVIRETL